MASKKRSYDNEGKEILENLTVEDTFDNEEREKESESESESHSKPCKHRKKEESLERIWNEDQEIAVLQSAIKFSSQKGVDPADHKTDFFAFIRESQSFDGDFSRAEVAAKLKSLKKKLKRNLIKGKGISSSHEHKIFKLSKKIWGSKDPNKPLLCPNEISIISENHVGLGENIVKEAMKQIEEAKRVEFVRQWKEIQVMELELSNKRAALVEYQIQIMLDAYNKSSKQ